MKIRNILTGIVAIGVLPAMASAAETRVVVVQPRAQSSVQLGGGVNTFTRGFDDVTKPGAAYDVRAAFGIHSPLGLELAYVGSMNDLKDVSGAGSNDRLMQNGGEALARLNLGGNGDLIPYVAAGLGLTDSRIMDSNGNTVSVGNSTTGGSGPTFNGNSTDFHVPAAAGIDAVLGDRLTLGARASYKYDFGNGLRSDVAKADIQSWQATAHLGLAF